MEVVQASVPRTCEKSDSQIQSNNELVQKNTNDCFENHDSSELMECEQSVDYSKQQRESQIDYVRRSGVLKNEGEVRKGVDQISEESYKEKDLPNEFRDRVTIAEPSSSTHSKKREGASAAIKILVPEKKITAQSPPLPPSPIHHITWDGFDETSQTVGQSCLLCEKDLSTSALDKFEFYEYFEPVNLPDVAVLPCGHTFHSECLESITPENQRHDPPCFLCLSCIT